VPNEQKGQNAGPKRIMAKTKEKEITNFFTISEKLMLQPKRTKYRKSTRPGQRSCNKEGFVVYLATLASNPLSQDDTFTVQTSSSLSIDEKLMKREGQVWIRFSLIRRYEEVQRYVWSKVKEHQNTGVAGYEAGYNPLDGDNA